jgi:threonine-phosphate decarboxylase
MHGGDIYSDDCPRGRKLTDFSANSNPYGPPEGVEAALREALGHARRYPDTAYRDLKNHIIDYHGLSGTSVILGNGAGEIINSAFRGLKKVVLLGPGYSEYEKSALEHGVAISWVMMKEEAGEGFSSFSFPLEEALTALKEAEGILVAHPNNPDGNVLGPEAMEALVDFARTQGKRLVVDETFFDYAGDQVTSFTEYSSQEMDLVVIRAITKFYGLPGVRFGYGLVSDPATCETMRAPQLPWNINSFAETFAKICLADRDYQRRMAGLNAAERARFGEALRTLPMIRRVYHSEGNYLLVELRDWQGIRLKEKLLALGYLIRSCHDYRGLGPGHVRLAVKRPEDNRGLVEALKTLV